MPDRYNSTCYIGNNLVESLANLQLQSSQKINEISNDPNLADESEHAICTEQAIRSYVNIAIFNTDTNQSFGDEEFTFGVFNGDVSKYGSYFDFLRPVRLRNSASYRIVCATTPLKYNIINKTCETSNQISPSVPSSFKTANDMWVEIEELYNNTLGINETEQIKSYKVINKGLGVEVPTYLDRFYIAKIPSFTSTDIEYSYCTIRKNDDNNLYLYFIGTNREDCRGNCMDGNTKKSISFIPNGVHRIQLLDVVHVFLDQDVIDQNETSNYTVLYADKNMLPASTISATTVSALNGKIMLDVNENTWYTSNGSTFIKKRYAYLGALGIENNETGNAVYCTAAYSVPGYRIKSQRNSIRLEKVGNKIRTKDLNNIVTVGHKIVDLQYQYIIWEPMLEIGKPRYYWLYLDFSGKPLIKTSTPYRNNYNGYYANGEIARCVGVVYFDGANLQEPWDFNGDSPTTMIEEHPPVASSNVIKTGIASVQDGILHDCRDDNENVGGIALLQNFKNSNNFSIQFSFKMSSLVDISDYQTILSSYDDLNGIKLTVTSSAHLIVRIYANKTAVLDNVDMGTLQYNQNYDVAITYDGTIYSINVTGPSFNQTRSATNSTRISNLCMILGYECSSANHGFFGSINLNSILMSGKSDNISIGNYKWNGSLDFIPQYWMRPVMYFGKVSAYTEGDESPSVSVNYNDKFANYTTYTSYQKVKNSNRHYLVETSVKSLPAICNVYADGSPTSLTDRRSLFIRYDTLLERKLSNMILTAPNGIMTTNSDNVITVQKDITLLIPDGLDPRGDRSSLVYTTTHTKDITVGNNVRDYIIYNKDDDSLVAVDQNTELFIQDDEPALNAQTTRFYWYSPIENIWRRKWLPGEDLGKWSSIIIGIVGTDATGEITTLESFDSVY